VLPKSTAKRIGELIQASDRLLVISHISPDGDSFGSITATGLALHQLGKSYSLVIDDGVQSRFSFLPLADLIQTSPDSGNRYDLIIALDCGDLERLGYAYSSLTQPQPPIINIDHHITNTQFGEVNLVNPDAAATVEILFELFPAIGVQLTTDLATCLLTGLITDTLGFRTASTSSNTLKIASSLVEAGVNLYNIFTKALIEKPFSTILLWQKGLDNMRMDDGVLWTSISKEERQETGRIVTGSSGLGNLLANVDHVAMSVVFTETDDSQVTVSFRCRPPYSVSELARELGGGGHHLAAGCTLAGRLEEVERLVVKKAVAQIRDQRAMLARSGKLSVPV